MALQLALQSLLVLDLLLHALLENMPSLELQQTQQMMLVYLVQLVTQLQQRARHLFHSVMFALMVTLVLLHILAQLPLDALFHLSESILLEEQQLQTAQLVTQLQQPARHLLHSVMFAQLAILVLQS